MNVCACVCGESEVKCRCGLCMSDACVHVRVYVRVYTCVYECVCMCM